MADSAAALTAMEAQHTQAMEPAKCAAGAAAEAARQSLALPKAHAEQVQHPSLADSLDSAVVLLTAGWLKYWCADDC